MSMSALGRHWLLRRVPLGGNVQNRARAARPDRVPAASPARGRGVAAPLRPPPPQALFRPTAPPHSCVVAPFRTQMALFLFRRSIEKFVACPSCASQRASQALLRLEATNDPPEKPFPLLQRAEFCRQAITNRNIRPRDRQSVAQ